MAPGKNRAGSGQSGSDHHRQRERIQIPALKLSNLKFRTKILLVYVVFVVSAAFLLTLFLVRPETTRLYDEQISSLTVEAEQMALLLPGEPIWTKNLNELAAAADIRLTVIDPDGTVVGDSDHDSETMQNHADRPEVREALSGRSGRDRRFSATAGLEMLYVAVPLRDSSGAVTGVVRVAKPWSGLTAAMARIRAGFAGGAAVAAALALIFGAIIITQLTRPLRALETAARQLGAGAFNTRVREFGQDELGVFARTFNRMARQLNNLVTNLSEERSKLLAILSTMADGVIVFDHHQRVLMANRTAGDFLGFDPQKVTGCSLPELLLPPRAVVLIKEAVKSGTDVEGDFEVHLPEQRLLSAILTPIRDSGLRLYGTLVVLRDLTTLRHLERVRQDFVANVSHELRTPLTAVKAMTETLLAGDVDEARRRQFLTSIDAEVDRLTALVGDLLVLTKLDNNAANPRREEFSLPELIVDTIDRLHQPEPARHPTIDLPPDLPRVKADPEQIRQILINLLDNALKHTPADAAVGVRAAYDDDNVMISVWDEGPGIPEAEHERIFERFYRLDKARSRAMGGTGLGLAIVKHLAEANGGRVWVENKRGAEFSFTVPRSLSE